MKNEITIKLNLEQFLTTKYAIINASEQLKNIYDGFENIDDKKKYPEAYKKFITYNHLSNELDKCFEKCFWGGEYVIQ